MTGSRLVVLVGGLAGVVLAGCSTAPPAAAPTTSPSSPAMGATAAETEEVPLVTPTPEPPLRVEIWDGLALESVCITGTERYQEWREGQGDDESELVAVPGLGTPVQDGLTEGFDEAELPVVEDDCPATLTVDLVGTVSCDVYDVVGRVYRGLELDGTLSFSADGRRTLTERVDLVEETPETVGSTPGQERTDDEPSGAPVMELAEQDLCEILVGWFEAPWEMQPALLWCTEG